MAGWVVLLSNVSIYLVDIGVEEAEPVGFDGVGDLLDANCGNLSVVLGHLQESLVIDVIFVRHQKLLDLPHNLHNIQVPLLQGLTRQMPGDNIKPKDLLGERAHVLVSLIVVEVEGVEVVEDLVEVLGDLPTDVDDRLEALDLADVEKLAEVLDTGSEGVFVVDLLDEH